MAKYAEVPVHIRVTQKDNGERFVSIVINDENPGFLARLKCIFQGNRTELLLTSLEAIDFTKAVMDRTQEIIQAEHPDAFLAIS